MFSTADIIVLSAASFFANLGVAVTGFGMGITFIFVWQIAVEMGYSSDIKFAIFIQALSLLAVQPLLFRNAEIHKHGTPTLLKILIPVVLITTPIGQLASAYAEGATVKLVTGIIVSFAAGFELYRNRAFFSRAGFVSCFRQRNRAQSEDQSARLSTIRIADGSGSNHVKTTKKNIKEQKMNFDHEAPVFFMIGSQRSGSNWLRTMLNEREDLASPHPPHILRDMMPVLDKFGDLNNTVNLSVMIDHVSTFVERNLVTWVDKHGRPILFDRDAVLWSVNLSTKALAERTGTSITNPDFLVATMDEVMNVYAIANDKRTWMCKSMDNSKFHDLLLRFYTPKRLRYLYLVRDPRDVAMSFMKTAVGDCHLHAIVTKWVTLQRQALLAIQNVESIQVAYEDLVTDKDATMKDIFEFLGERTFGRLTRKTSVRELTKLTDVIKASMTSPQTKITASLSAQFQNLTRGDSFTKKQYQKWRKELGEKDIIMIESIAHEVMTQLDFEVSLVTKSVAPIIWSNEEIIEFGRINKERIAEMYKALSVENPVDAERRMRQAEVLNLPATLLTPSCEIQAVASGLEGTLSGAVITDHHGYPSRWPVGAGAGEYLRESDVLARFQMQNTSTVEMTSGIEFRVAVATQRGYYPTALDKHNQDDFLVKSIGGPSLGRPATSVLWMSVFDGHGPVGELCARFAKESLPRKFEAALSNNTDGANIDSALFMSHLAVDEDLCAGESGIDASNSGTTAVSMCIVRDTCYVSNVGDSCAMVGGASNGNSAITAKVLSADHTPFASGELARLKALGTARVLNTAQVEGEEPLHENWNKTDTSDVPRVWALDGKYPGTAFTRSIGDSIAKTLGVFAEPDIAHHKFSIDDRVIIIASDGITDYFTPEECVRVAMLYDDPLEACRALVGEAYKRWITEEERSDDITVIVARIDHPKQDTVFEIEGGLSMTTPVSLPDDNDNVSIDGKMLLWILTMGSLSGFLGGFNGIPGPPLIIFFLHSPVTFTKKSQRANGAMLQLASVATRLLFYLVQIAVPRAFNDEHAEFEGDLLTLYLTVIAFSYAGVTLGGNIFERLADSKNEINFCLSILLVICGASLLLSALL